LVALPQAGCADPNPPSWLADLQTPRIERLTIMDARMNYTRVALAAASSLVISATASAQGTRLLRSPTVSHDQIAFAYASDLWVVGRNGGQARRLTSTASVETEPRFSPDGKWVAYSATVGGNMDVYVVPTEGGEPRRLTYHPGPDMVRGWTPDGKRVIFGSGRTSAPTPYTRLWTVGLDGALPEPLPMPRAFSGVFSPDGRRLAYEEFSTTHTGWAIDRSSQWRHYRGGRTHPISVMTLADYSVEKLPWTNSNDTDPMWVGNTIYFLSDRNNTVNLFAWNPNTKSVTQLTRHDDFDIMNASAGPDAIVYEQAGYIHLFDIKEGRSRRLEIEVKGDLPWTRAQFKVPAIRNAVLSPDGSRAAFEARGEILIVPASKGDTRNITQSPGVHDRSPAWSPDGSQLAWLSDESGEYQLMLGAPNSYTKPRVVSLPSGAFFSAPSWSPDGKSILLQDSQLNLWMVDVAAGRFTRIATDLYDEPGREFDAVWSPDSRWVAYSRSLNSRMRAIFVHSLATGKAIQLTDGLADAISPAFDAGGKYLYFLASTNFGPGSNMVDMSSLDRPSTRAIYLAVLSSAEPSPFLPETGDEAAPAAPARAGRDTAGVVVRVDSDGIGQRILAVNVPAGEYRALSAGPAGSFFYLVASPGNAGRMGAARLQRYQVKERAAQPFLEGISSYTLSHDKKKLLYSEAGGSAGASARGGGPGRWGIVPTDRPAKAGDGSLDLSRLQTWVDPRAEWAQIFRETWRIQREYFYDAQMHGADWSMIYKKYQPWLAHVGHRADLGYLIAMVGGELVVGHSYLTGGGDIPGEDPISVGLLGADFAVEHGRYRIRKIYSGENWNPDLQAPLSAPGIDVSEGDYVLEVNGRPLVAATNIYSLFQGTVGRQTVIRVNSTPTTEGSRLVTVVPIANEGGLRARAWIEGNRRMVDKLSGGRLAYVWLPNTATAGYTYFNRYYFAQQDKEGAVIDERYNGGGQVADYIVNELDRKLDGYFARRAGNTKSSPGAGIFGPKVMVINESAGSGGDALPYMFRLRKLGPLVGTRTWGGLVGTLDIPSTIDGGGITAPSLAFYDLQGKWAVENEGVAPDIEVEYTPAEVIQGRDPQLERAVQEALKLLEKGKVRHTPRPAPINRVKQ
jgi:tricorn protease